MASKPFYDIIVVIPIGPGSSVAFISDTIESYAFYTKSSFQIILVDDSREDIGAEILKIHTRFDNIITQRALGGWAGLYVNLGIAYSYALENYDFKALLKLDTDALIIGSEPENSAINLFEAKPMAGMAGQYPNEYDGTPWNIRWPRQRIINGTRTWKFLRRPIANWKLIKFYGKAKKNGYVTGESVFGGAYFLNVSFLKVLLKQGLLPDHTLRSLNLGEDHIFSLLAKANGFSLESLSAGHEPMACAWQGLPAAPAQLIDDNKKIIHSVRQWADMGENEIRLFYKNKRHETMVKFNTNTLFE